MDSFARDIGGPSFALFKAKFLKPTTTDNLGWIIPGVGWGGDEELSCALEEV